MDVAGTTKRDEGGFELVETVVALAILGLIIAALVGGMATSIATSDTHRQQSVANAVMVSAVETVKMATYTSCASSYSTDAVLPAGWAAGPTGAITERVQYWNPQSFAWDAAPVVPLPCHDLDGSGLFPMQLVTVTVTHPGNRASTTVGVVKRGP